MKRIFAIALICSLLCTTRIYSQVGSHFAMQYDISFGIGDLGDYISAASFRGATFQYRYAVNSNILIGIDAAWNVFYEKKDYDSYTMDTRTLSGVQCRHQNQVPILAAVDYLFKPGSTLQPYIGFGLGTMYSERYTEMGIWALENNPWQFVIKPELGGMYRFNARNAAKLSLRYYSGFGGDLDTQSYLSVSIGFVL